MNRLEKKFSELQRSKKKALSIFLTAGYPSLAATESLILSLEKSGVDFFEIGFPFSDPIADGHTIQRSSEIALKNGMRWDQLLKLCKRVRQRSEVPLVLMSYANTLFCRGWKNAICDLATSGFDGAIIPDLIPEEGQQLQSLFRSQGLSLIYLLAPTSTPHRMETISKASSGFVYCVSVTGVTGAREDLPSNEIRSFLQQVRKKCSLPILLGFGISRFEQARSFSEMVDGFVIGSAVAKILEEKKELKFLVRDVENFVRTFL